MSLPTFSRMSYVPRNERRPLKHVQVREYLRSLIAEYGPGSPTPSERDLVDLFQVSRMTVRQAVDGLVMEGLLERFAGRGTFVAKPRRATTRVSGLGEELRKRGIVCDSETLLARIEQAGPSVSRELGLALGDRVVHWRRLRRADGTPICVEDNFLAESSMPDFTRRSALPPSLYSDLATRGLCPTWVGDEFSADVATLDEAIQLECRVGGPVIRHKRRTVADVKVVVVSKSVFRGDCYTVQVQLGQGD